MKKNCWEYKRCGREPGGAKTQQLGVCPAATETRMDGVHGGKNAGRSCWVLAGTLCGGAVQGTFAQKYANCKNCDFYELVKSEEYPHFILSAVLNERLK
ncbi:MAG: two-CW domain-containing protein [Bacillota bacterium]